MPIKSVYFYGRNTFLEEPPDTQKVCKKGKKAKTREKKKRKKHRGGSRGRVQGVRAPPSRDDLRFSNTTGILKKKTMWFIAVEVEQETSAPPPKKNPGSAPETTNMI